jgi:hypothetical protein
MVNGARVDSSVKAYRLGHRFGNRLLTGLVSRIFGQMTSDMLSGYKAFSRRYVKSFPAHSRGFEIETELMVHALELRMGIDEVSTPYAERPEGSTSKLRTVRDGVRILSVIGLFVKEERPIQVFSFAAAFLAFAAMALGLPVVAEWIVTGLVPRFPTAILASAMMLMAVIALFAGLILDTVTRGRREMKRLAYLSVPNRIVDGDSRPETPSADAIARAIGDLGGVWSKTVSDRGSGDIRQATQRKSA